MMEVSKGTDLCLVMMHESNKSTTYFVFVGNCLMQKFEANLEMRLPFQHS